MPGGSAGDTIMHMTSARKFRRKGGQGPQVLDYAEVNKLLRAGYTQQQVADKAGTTQSAISAARRRGVVTEGRGWVRSAIPWALRPEHRNLNVPKMLRCAARLEAGETIGESNRKAARQFIEGLRLQGAVIHYDPEVAPYFFRVPRREGVDAWLVRDPSLDNRGRQVQRMSSAR